ncbi:MAG: tetratricopeptide repeat protein [Cyclobacteriaceae bacterium]
MRHLLIIFLLTVIAPFAYCQSEEHIDSLNLILADSACSNELFSRKTYQSIASKLRDSHYPQGQVDALKNYGTMMYCLGKTDSAIILYRQGGYYAEKENLLTISGKLFNNVGFIFQMNGEYDSSIYNFKKALKIAKSIGDPMILSSVYSGIGIVQQHSGQLDSALATYLKAFQVAEENDIPKLGVVAMLNIATIHYDHFPERLDVKGLETNLEFAREVGDRRSEISFLEFLGYISSDSSKHTEAIAYFNQALQVNKELKDQNAQVLILQGLAYAYTNKGDYRESSKVLEDAIQVAMTSGSESNLPRLYLDKTLNYLRINSYDLAEKNANESIRVAERLKSGEHLANAYKYLAEALNGKGAFAEAYQAQLEHSRLSKEILDAAKSEQLTEMETKYETERKEAEIAKLSQQASIQVLQIQQRNQTIVIGLIVFILIIVIAYFLYRERSLRNERSQTELEQRFLRSQLNPHFIFNALLAIQNFMLKNDGPKAALYLTKFSKLMREILESSRQEFIPLESEVELITNYLDIHKLRLNDSFDYSIEIDDQIDPETDTIPPMFVQPFVENAIEHGIADKKEGGLIEIKFHKSENHIFIEVLDNGKGLFSAESKSHKSLASRIIRERMALFNKTLKNKIQLVLDNVENESGEILGTKVELKVPFRYT